MKLTKYKIVIEGSFNELLGKAEEGDVILLYEGNFNDWRPHPEGVVIRLAGKLTLNGFERWWREKVPCSESYFFPHYVYGELKLGVDCLHNFSIDNHHLSFDGRIDEWKLHPHGIVIRQDNKFMLIVCAF